MFRRSSVLLMVCAAALAWSGAVSAQDDNDTVTYSAVIHSGMCDDMGEEVQVLDDSTALGTGEHVGVEGLATVVLSETDDDEIDVSASTLIESPHSIVAYIDDSPVACGEIGGLLDDDEDLWIGLEPLEDSGFFGIVELENIDDDDDDDLEIDVYLVQPVD